jgi:hypothetical protein
MINPWVGARPQSRLGPVGPQLGLFQNGSGQAWSAGPVMAATACLKQEYYKLNTACQFVKMRHVLHHDDLAPAQGQE